MGGNMGMPGGPPQDAEELKREQRERRKEEGTPHSSPA